MFIILTLFLLLAMFIPSIWIKWVMRKHSTPIDDMPGTGGELAAHLLAQFKMAHIQVKETEDNRDRFEPDSQTVFLSPNNFQGKSITAISVAAHEVGHAIQFERKEKVSQLRDKYVPQAIRFKKLGIVIFGFTPLLAVIIKIPALIGLLFAMGLILQLLGAILYWFVLPEEWNASFDKALPILKEGQYLPEQYHADAEQVLKAAAYTYFAGALADILNIGRWFMLLRR
jgi:uncharacterized protein